MGSTVVARLTNHAKILTEGGAAHQQELANDLKDTVRHLEALTAAAQQGRDQLANVKGNIDRALDDRDQARKDLADLKEKFAKLQADYDYLLDVNARLGVASTEGETHAELKAKSRK